MNIRKNETVNIGCIAEGESLNMWGGRPRPTH
jgi:hypothetical protein